MIYVLIYKILLKTPTFGLISVEVEEKFERKLCGKRVMNKLKHRERCSSHISHIWLPFYKGYCIMALEGSSL